MTGLHPGTRQHNREHKVCVWPLELVCPVPHPTVPSRHICPEICAGSAPISSLSPSSAGRHCVAPRPRGSFPPPGGGRRAVLAGTHTGSSRAQHLPPAQGRHPPHWLCSPRGQSAGLDADVSTRPPGRTFHCPYGASPSEKTVTQTQSDVARPLAGARVALTGPALRKKKGGAAS